MKQPKLPLPQEPLTLGICQNTTAVRPSCSTPKQVQQKVKGHSYKEKAPQDVERFVF